MTITNLHAGQTLALILCLTVGSLTMTGCTRNQAQAAADGLITAADLVVGALPVIPAPIKALVLDYSADATAAAACAINAVSSDTGTVLASAEIACVKDLGNIPPSIAAYVGPIGSALQAILALFPTSLAVRVVSAKKLNWLERIQLRHAKSGAMSKIAAVNKKIAAAR